MDSILWLTANVIYTQIYPSSSFHLLITLLRIQLKDGAEMYIYATQATCTAVCVMHDPKAFMNWVHTEIIQARGHIHTCIWYFGRFFWIHMQFTE